MKKRQKVTIGLIVLNLLCVLGWVFFCIEDITKGRDTSELVIHGICAVLWFLTVIVNCIRYKNEK